MHVLNTASGGRPLALGAGAAVAVVSAVALVTCSTAGQSEKCHSDNITIQLQKAVPEAAGNCTRSTAGTKVGIRDRAWRSVQIAGTCRAIDGADSTELGARMC